VGIALAVVVFNLLVGDGIGVLLGWIMPFLLGLGGAWAGPGSGSGCKRESGSLKRPN
jgi:hypothetical protein